MRNIPEIIKSEYIHTPNREMHEKAVTEKLIDLVVYYTFDYCCAVVKQIQVGIPQEKVRENLIKLLKG